MRLDCSRSPFVLVMVLLAFTATRAEEKSLSKVEIARRGKAATALVEVKTARAYGTAFCIHPSGLFLTNEHVIRPAKEAGDIALILHPGLKTEKSFTARVVRSDRGRDLALLQADARDLAVLPLGSNENVTELLEVVALGFPFGKALAGDKKTYPAISVNHGHVTALRRREGRLHRLQLDAVLNPGNSGGPVLDEHGQVVGLVVAGVLGTGVNFAIPVDEARRFVYQPEFQLVLPFVSRQTMHQSARFKARITTPVPLAKPLDVELILTAGDGKDRKFKMKQVKGAYEVQAVPVPPREGPLTFPLTAEYDKGPVTGLATDRIVTIRGKELRLSAIKTVRLKPTAEVVRVDGQVVKGEVSGLDGLTVQISDEPVRINLAKARALQCAAPPPVDAIACALIARQEGKEVGRTGDSIAIGGLPTDKPASSSGRLVGPIRAPALEQARVVRPLPSTIADVAAGGGGRFLILALPKVHKLALFDVSAARVVKYIAVEEDDVKFAAGQDRLVIVAPKKNVLERWNLATLERERSLPLPIREQATLVALGSASQGPVLVGTAEHIHFLDLQTLKPLDVQMPEDRPTGLGEGACVRASADGKVFGVWHGNRSPQGLETFTLIGHQLHAQYEHQSTGHVVPGPDGKVIFTGRGLYAPTLKPRKQDNDAGASYCVPAAQGPLYLSIRPGVRASCALHMVGNLGPLVQLADLDVPEGLLGGDREAFGSDRRFHFIPSAGLIITIPTSNDRLILHRFHLLEALKKADIDYLLVMSQPPAVVKKGETLTYQLEVLSRKGGVTYRVESGPKGLTISPAGLLRWAVPAGTEETEVSIILVVADRAGQEVFHTFVVSLRE